MKTEKVGALIYYKHLKILEEAQLTDEQIGKILIAAIHYDETGICPEFSSPLSAFFTMIKYDLDANREKWEAVKEERSRVGKLGGRPKKAKATEGEESKITNRFSEGDKQDVGEVPTVSSICPEIKQEAKNIGFFIDYATAQKFYNCGLDPEWLKSPHSFLELAAERINENYGDRPKGEQKALFISAVRTWEELREEYPIWRDNKIKHDAAVQQKAAEKAAWENHPKVCSCGNTLRVFHDTFFCDSCRGSYELNKENLEWEKKEDEEVGLISDFKKRHGGAR